MTDYRVKLPSFEGPLDLLLHLVRKNEYDIFDIPIAEITEQYLGFLELMSELNLEFASDYLVMAATLVKIKSALLLPRPAEDDEDAEDPRDELVRQILEYERFREASYDIEQRPQLGRDVFARTFPARELEEARREPGYLQVSIFDLMTAFRAVLSRTPGRNVTIIAQERYSIRERMTQITEILSERRSLLFENLFDNKTGKAEVIVTFLALLELMRQNLVALFQKERFGPIHITSRMLAGDDAETAGDARTGPANEPEDEGKSS